MSVTVRSLVPQRVEDFFTFFEQVAFADHPEWGCDCYCCFFHAQSRETWDVRTGEMNRAEARELILGGRMRGLLAYDRDRPVGWCHYDILHNLPGVRVFYGDLASADDSAAAIVCFTIAQGYRNQGIASALLRRAVEELKEQGIRRIEAYPVVNSDSQEHNYHGPLSMYLKQGFIIARQTKDHAVMVKTF